MAVDGRPVADQAGLSFRMATLKLGSTVPLAVLRGGRERVLPLAVARAPESPPRGTRRLHGAHPLSGASVANLSPALAEDLGLDTMRGGVAIVEIDGGSTARRLAFRVGDIVLRVNGRSARTVSALRALLAEPADRWRIAIRRGGETISAVFGV